MDLDKMAGIVFNTKNDLNRFKIWIGPKAQHVLTANRSAQSRPAVPITTTSHERTCSGPSPLAPKEIST